MIFNLADTVIQREEERIKDDSSHYYFLPLHSLHKVMAFSPRLQILSK